MSAAEANVLLSWVMIIGGVVFIAAHLAARGKP